MKETESIYIAAAPQEVWRVLIDVERWPEWTPTMAKVERLDSGPFGEGSRARIKVGGFPATVWRVTDFKDGRAFTWETESGLKVFGEHVVQPEGSGSRVTLTASASGLLAALFTPLMMLTTRGNVRKEAEGLKRRVEQGKPATATPER